jgi:hypothetical protein
MQMDYGKSGPRNKTKGAPRHAEHNAPGSTKRPFGTEPDKADLIARMKAAAEAKKKEE